jgi:hypothetical protein
VSVIANPLLDLLPKIKPNSVERPDDAELTRQWECVGSLVLGFQALLALGEYHREAFDGSGVARVIPHQLGRRPRVLIFTCPGTANAAEVYEPGGLESRTSRTLTLQSRSATTVEFWIA